MNAQETAKKLETFILNAVKTIGRENVLVAVSGGVDSATSLTLAVRSIGRKNVYPVLLPYGKLNDQGTLDALTLVNSLSIPRKNVYKIDIKPFVDTILNSDQTMDNLRRGNIMARVRMILLYDLEKKFEGIVLGTENKTEHLLGYYTRFGDEASDIEPLRSLYKTQVYQLAKYLKVPKNILNKPPTAGLWAGQTDEEEFGFSYALADEVLYLYHEKKLSRQAILKRGYDKKTINKLWWWIEKGKLKDKLPLNADIA